jgi:predicted nucleic acid-binding protein
MPDKIPRYYWDACVFLHVISPEDEGHTSRLKDLEHLLDSAENGEIKLLTSAISIAEVIYAAEEKQAGQLDPTVEMRIEELWRVGGPVSIAEYTRRVGMEARALARLGLPEGRVLKPYDAVHLATARLLEVDEFHSYDKPLQRYATAAGKVPYAIGEPPPAPNTLFSSELTS